MVIISEYLVGIGHNFNPNIVEAVNRSLDMALQKMIGNTPKLAIVLVSGHIGIINYDSVIQSVTKIAGQKTKLWGTTSDGLTINGIYIPRGDPSVGAMLIYSQDTFGVGSPNKFLHDREFAAQRAREAMRNAMKDAGKEGINPSLVLVSQTPQGYEEDIMFGIDDVVRSEEVKIIGGTAAGGSDTMSNVFTSYGGHQDLAVLAVYTDKRAVSSFAGPCRNPKIKGKVTALWGKKIYKIDNRNALDVFNEWRGELGLDPISVNINIPIASAQSPLCKPHEEGYTYSHVNGIYKEIGISTGTDWRIYSEIGIVKADPETIIQEVGRIPTELYNSLENAGWGLWVVCAGLISVLSTEQKNILAKSLACYSAIGFCSHGEQGRLLGKEPTLHGNLMVSFGGISN